MRKLPKVLSKDEKKSVLNQFNTRYPTPHRNLCMVRMMMEAGLRSGEVVALRPDHVDLDTGKVMIREGKGAKDRVVWISDSLCDLIQEWESRSPPSEWLFPTSKGTQVDTRYLRAMVTRVAEKADVAEREKVSPHTFRHTFATDLLKRTNLRVVQRALGHASITTTQIYTHITDDELEEAMRR